MQAITVHLDETRCFDCEMYADEAELPSDFEIREEQRSNYYSFLRASYNGQERDNIFFKI